MDTEDNVAQDDDIPPGKFLTFDLVRAMTASVLANALVHGRMVDDDEEWRRQSIVLVV